MSTRAEIDLMALGFLAERGTDCIGVIDSEEKLAAAMVFLDLSKSGLVISTISDDGPVYRLTPKGRTALAQAEKEPSRGR